MKQNAFSSKADHTSRADHISLPYRAHAFVMFFPNITVLQSLKCSTFPFFCLLTIHLQCTHHWVYCAHYSPTTQKEFSNCSSYVHHMINVHSLFLHSHLVESIFLTTLNMLHNFLNYPIIILLIINCCLIKCMLTIFSSCRKYSTVFKEMYIL